MERFLADLAGWTSDSRAADAARARARARRLRAQAEEQATLVASLVTLSELRSHVVAAVTGGRLLSGRVVGVARDFVVLRRGPAGLVLVPLSALASVRTAPEEASADAPSGPVRRSEVTLEQAVAVLAAERRRVSLATTAGPEVLSGELRAPGSDVAVLDVDGQPPGRAYVALGSLTEVSVFGSG